LCGIFASVGLAPEPHRIDIVAHRGPDGSGWQEFTSGAGPVALGHRRLSIVDVSPAGAQPMADASGRWRILLNGEIYNHIEIRRELEAGGESFVSLTDTEALLRAWIRWGPAVLPRLRGMFAFVIWDAAEERLTAARDRYGIKPLYMTEVGGGVAFGSEIKQLLGLPGQSGRMNPRRSFDFLAHGLIDHTHETMFADVRQLRGGEWAEVATAGGGASLSIRRWAPLRRDAVVIGAAEAAERLRFLLEESVRLHLRSDVPVGSCLSGGLDSSAIVCLASRLRAQAGHEPIRTVSACYDDASVDERPHIAAVVAATGARADLVFPRADDVFAEAERITWHQDEPFGSTSIFAQWCVFRQAREAGLKVMLDGQGADEQLAGYHGAFSHHLAALLRGGDLGGAAAAALARSRRHGAPLAGQLLHAALRLMPAPVVASARRWRERWEHHDWMAGPLADAALDGRTAAQEAEALLGLAQPRGLGDLCFGMVHATNLQMLLHWEDRNSMAHSIEARVPFLDHELVDFTLSLGDEHKIVDGETKRVLREAMRGIIPDSVRMRQDKLGFATPEAAWFTGPLQQAMRQGIAETLSRFPGLFMADGVSRRAEAILSGRRAPDFWLWRMVNFGIWGRRFNVSM